MFTGPPLIRLPFGNGKDGFVPIKLCTRKLLHALSQYIAIINGSKNVHTPGAHLLKSCTRPWKCASRVQGAPLISDTVHGCHGPGLSKFLDISLTNYIFSLTNVKSNLIIKKTPIFLTGVHSFPFTRLFKPTRVSESNLSNFWSI